MRADSVRLTAALRGINLDCRLRFLMVLLAFRLEDRGEKGTIGSFSSLKEGDEVEYKATEFCGSCSEGSDSDVFSVATTLQERIEYLLILKGNALESEAFVIDAGR